MRPAEPTRDANGGASANGSRIESVQRAADGALGATRCAYCGDPEAAPTLAGDRARGPDHLYLVCDRCGGRWQRHKSDAISVDRRT